MKTLTTSEHLNMVHSMAFEASTSKLTDAVVDQGAVVGPNEV